ncbi:MAG: hypothetical protein ACTSU5_04625 [Promethearchaeota archaeon]
MVNLLDEMVENRMNLLSLVMRCPGYLDPRHDGFSWPVMNPKLQCYVDKEAINANPATEFVSEVIKEARKRGIEVEFYLDWGLWNPAKIRDEYPESGIQMWGRGTRAGWYHCHDSPGARQLALDEATDLLTFYADANVTRFTFGHLEYAFPGYCVCEYSKRQFEEDRGHPLKKRSYVDEAEDWMRDNLERHLVEYVGNIKKARPDIQVGIHTRGFNSMGHFPSKYQQLGISYVEPPALEFKEYSTNFMLHKVWKFLKPNPIVAHLSVQYTESNSLLTRARLWEKTPKVIRKTLGSIRKYKGGNLEGVLFFNEPEVSEENKRAIYEEIKKFD